MEMWKFTKIDRIEELSFHKVLERFYNNGIEGLVRENLQNSLDGKIKSSTEPVRVKIEIGLIKKQQIPGIDKLEVRINSLKGQNDYTEKTISHIQKKVKKSEINYISFEDINTTGLSGAKKGQTNDSKDTYSAYAYKKGVHHIDTNDEFEKARGGSHGIGKIASNAASDIHIMFFANCDEEGNKHLGGNIQLIEHDYKGNYYRATGYFTDESNGEFYPYVNDYDDVFKKDTRGLKIIIPFFRSQFNEETDIVKSVCDNFFLAIIKNELAVEVNNFVIDDNTIGDIINDEKYYPQELEEYKTVFTPLYFNTYKNYNKRTLSVLDKKKTNYEFDLYFNYDKRIPKGRVGIIRTVGMKIEDKKIIGNATKPFNAVLIPKSTTEDYFLKSLENESHSELAYDHIKDIDEQKNAKRFINNISREIAKIIEEYIRKNNPTDGLMDIEDILYDVENRFRNELEKASSKLVINEKRKKKTIIKVETPKRGKKESNKNTEKKKSGIRKVKKKMGNDTAKEYFYVKPNYVKRAILSDFENLSIDLRNETNLDGVNYCDIHFALIDGMGNEYMNEFLISSNYKKISGDKSKKDLTIENNTLKNVPINEKTIDLRMELSNQFNKTLKYVYYLEV